MPSSSARSGTTFTRGPIVIDRLLWPETVAWFDQKAARYGHTTDGVLAALRDDDELRVAASFSNTRSLVNSWFGLLSYGWHAMGRPTYFLTPALTQALAATDLREAPPEAVFAPHPIFALVLPEDCPITVSTPTDELPLSAVLVLADREILLAGTEAISPHVPDIRRVGPEAMPLEGIDDLAGPFFGMLPIAWGGTPDNTSFAWYTVSMSSPSLEESVERACRVTKAMRGMDTRAGAREQLALVLKTLLYINTRGAQVDSLPYEADRRPGKSPKAREVQARLRRKWGSRVLLGRSLRVADGEGANHGGGVRLHQVRGHFKRQRVGEGGTDRRLIWIAPYWRGLDDFGMTVERRYVTGE